MSTKQEKETVTIRIDPRTKSAIDALAAVLAVKEGRKVTQSEAIWHAVQTAEPEIAKMMTNAENANDASQTKDEK